MEEIFKQVPDYELYLCSNYGRVFSIKSEKFLKPTPDKDGYLQVAFHKNGKEKKAKVHRVVAELFIPNPDNKREVNHVNGIKSDNRADNLEWCTRSENAIHAYKTGLMKSGEERYNAKLTAAQVLEIRAGNLTTVELAKKFNVDGATISYIQRGKKYKNVGGKIRIEHGNKLSAEIEAAILKDYQPNVYGHGSISVAKKYGVSQTTVLNIYRRATKCV